MAALTPSKSKWVACVCRTIFAIPPGKVSTYAAVAEAAGYPGYHRQVAMVLRRFGDGLPWHRVLGAGGKIKTRQDVALDQRTLLVMEGVKFKGRRVDMAVHSFTFPRKGYRTVPVSTA